MQSINNAQNELDNSIKNDSLQSNFEEQARHIHSEQQVIQQYVDSTRARQGDWLKRMFTPTEEKAMLATFWAKQNEGLDIVMSDRNKAIQLIGEAQLEFIQTVCINLRISTQSQLQLNRSIAFQQRLLILQTELETLNRSFTQLLMDKIQGIDQYNDPLRDLQQRQFSKAIKQWEHTYDKLLDDFTNILSTAAV